MYNCTVNESINHLNRHKAGFCPVDETKLNYTAHQRL